MHEAWNVILKKCSIKSLIKPQRCFLYRCISPWNWPFVDISFRVNIFLQSFYFKCVLCCFSSGQGGSWGKLPQSCRTQRRPRPRGEHLSTATWLWSCLHMYYTSSHWVNWRHTAAHAEYYTHNLCCCCIHFFMPVSLCNSRPPDIVQHFIQVGSVIWFVQPCDNRWWGGVGSVLCLALRALVRPW